MFQTLCRRHWSQCCGQLYMQYRKATNKKETDWCKKSQYLSPPCCFYSHAHPTMSCCTHSFAAVMRVRRAPGGKSALCLWTSPPRGACSCAACSFAHRWRSLARLSVGFLMERLSRYKSSNTANTIISLQWRETAGGAWEKDKCYLRREGGFTASFVCQLAEYPRKRCWWIYVELGVMLDRGQRDSLVFSCGCGLNGATMWPFYTVAHSSWGSRCRGKFILLVQY